MELGDLLMGEAAPVNEQALRDSGADVRIARDGDPLGESVRARSWSRGWDIESPVTSRERRGRRGGGGTPMIVGSKASAVTGATADALAFAGDVALTKLPVLESARSGESHAVRECVTLWRGS